MKIELFLAALILGTALPALAGADKVAVKSRKADIDPEEDVEDLDDDDNEEWDMEAEIFGPKVERFEGIHILDENLEIILNEPSERVLRALGEPKENKNALTLEKVKVLYREQIEKQERERSKNMAYSDKDFENMLAKEQQVAEKEKEAAEDDSIMKRVMDYIW